MQQHDRDFDLIVWGATGYTGAFVARHVARTYRLAAEAARGEEGALRWAIAGRNEGKLVALRGELAELNEGNGELEILLGDAMDQDSVDAVVGRAFAVISAAGPFAKYGESVVSACARLGTHYFDVTGEAQFIRAMMDKYGDVAKEHGAIMIPFCGVDSVPSDLGTYLAVSRVRESGREPVDGRGIWHVKGALSSGTVDSIFNILEMPIADLKKMQHVDFLTDRREGRRRRMDARERGRKWVEYNEHAQSYTMPYLMAGCNNLVVRRSATLLDYGDRFAYNEGLRTKSWFAAALGSIVMAVIMIFGFFGPIRRFARKFLPSSGTGQSEDKLETNFFRTRVLVTADDGEVVTAEIAGGDCYKDTGTMAAECALTAVFNFEQLPDSAKQGGFHTPASALGHQLAQRLESVGMTARVLDQ